MEPRFPPAAFPWSPGLKELLAESEEWLMERVLAYARTHGYSRYTATLVEPWRVSIAGLTAALMAAVDVFDGRPIAYPCSGECTQAATDPVAAFAVREAGRHKDRGVTLPMFWGLFKYYRQAYLDVLEARLPSGPDRDAAVSFVAQCFERMEFTCVLAWNDTAGQESLEALGRENRQLASEKNKYLSVFESIPYPLFLLDGAGCVKNCNVAALTLIGRDGLSGAMYYNAEEGDTASACRDVVGHPLIDFLPWLGPVLEKVEGGADRASFATTVGAGEDMRYYSALVERLHDVSSQGVGKVVLCRDTTTRRKAEIALAQSEERYRTLIDIMHQGLVIFSPEGRVDFANETLSEMLGYSMAELVGHPALAFIRPDDHDRFIASLSGRQNGGADPYEVALRRRDGRLLFVMSSPSPIIGQDGDYQGSLEVLTDVTRLKQLELQLLTAKRLEAIGQLAGGVAHEINTPLQYVSGNLDFAMTNLPRIIELLGKYDDLLRRIEEGGESYQAARGEIEAFRREHDMEMVLAELPQALAESLHGAERVASFVRSIKRFAQTEGMGRRGIDVNEAILATVEMAKSAQEKQIPVEVDLAEDLPPLPCVPGDFNQLLLCLLLNAAEAMQQGPSLSGCVRVASQLEGRSVSVTVSDTGPGIPPELQDKIFNPFFSTKDVGKGGGQGLPIALSIVEKHHGTIHFVSEPGQGTTFHVTFPLE